jgi:hypothetical protein
MENLNFFELEALIPTNSENNINIDNGKIATDTNYELLYLKE